MSATDDEVRSDYLPTFGISTDDGVLVDARNVADVTVMAPSPEGGSTPLVMVLPYGENDTLTGRELAVLIDSLSAMVSRLDGEAPNVQSALEKIRRLVSPATGGLRVIALER